jgi:hypothetical protein
MPVSPEITSRAEAVRAARAAGEGPAHGPVGGYPGQEIAKAEGTQHQDARRHG